MAHDSPDANQPQDAKDQAEEKAAAAKDSFLSHIHPVIFSVSAAIILVFVALGVMMPEGLGSVTGDIQSWIIEQFGWLYIVSVTIFLLFLVWLFFSPYGHIKLGKDDDEPEYSTLTWFAMLFSAGMGIGLLFWGVAEPVNHFHSPPRVASGTQPAEEVRAARERAAELTTRAEALEARGEMEQSEALATEAEAVMASVADQEAAANEAAQQAINTTYFHWGFHAWGIYVLMGLALAYFAYRHDLPLTIRSTLYPLIGQRIHGPIGNAVEILAVFGTLFGLATSLGLGAMQINRGAEFLGLFDYGVTAQILLIAGITLCATVSVVTGLDVGIRRLSELNLFLGVALMLFIFIAGPTVFLLSSYVQSLGNYVSSLAEMTFRTDAFVGTEWQGYWTMFYWGWWISWSPFVGMFVARISRGRRIREFVLGVLLVPTLLTFAWITIFGNTALHMEVFGDGGMIEATIGSLGGSADTALFQMIDQLSAPGVLITLATVMASIVIATYFITSSDSASLVVDILTSGGNPNPPIWTRVFWAVSEGAVAAVLLGAGAATGNPDGGLYALRNAAIITGLPFCILLLVMCVSVAKGLRAEREAGVASVPYTPAHPAEHHSITPEAYAEAPGDWRSRLHQIIGKKKLPATNGELAEARQNIRDFIDHTVTPALNEIKGELTKQGREVEVYDHDTSATLIVRRDGDEEFRYAIRGRALRRAAVAFPELDQPDTPRILRAEVVLRGGVAGEYDLEEFTHHGIIEDFLYEYAKWMGW